MYRVLFFVLTFCFSLNATANEQALVETLKLILNDKPTLDLTDPDLNARLKGYDFYVFQVYRAYIHYQDALSQERETLSIKQDFLKPGSFPAIFFPEKKSASLHELLLLSLSSEHLLFDIPYTERVSRKVYGKDRYLLPLWLVRREPEILNLFDGRFFPRVLGAYSIDDLPEYPILYTLLDEINTYEPGNVIESGSIYIDIGAYEFNLEAKISYAPQLLLNPPKFNLAEDKKIIEKWSHKNAQYQAFYQALLVAVDNMTRALSGYYKQHDMAKYADNAEDLVWTYVIAVLGAGESVDFQAYRAG